MVIISSSSNNNNSSNNSDSNTSEEYKRGRIKRGCSQKPDLQIGFKTGPRNMYW